MTVIAVQGDGETQIVNAPILTCEEDGITKQFNCRYFSEDKKYEVGETLGFYLDKDDPTTGVLNVFNVRWKETFRYGSAAVMLLSIPVFLLLKFCRAR